MADELTEWLARETRAILNNENPSNRYAASPISSGGSASSFERQIADQLVAEALENGLSVGKVRIEDIPLRGGNTADRVAKLNLSLPFVFKMDVNSRKLADEGRTVRLIKTDERLPSLFKDAWPNIFAVRSEAPFAYLMEYFPKEEGWISLEDRLYPEPSDLKARDRKSDSAEADPQFFQSEVPRWMARILDVLFSGWTASVDQRSSPRLEEDYLGRIASRLESAEDKDDRFRSQPLEITSPAVERLELRPWREYVSILERNHDRLLAMTPPFRTVVHGDPNPGNLLLKITPSEVAVRMIDPKEWYWGDYLFDIAKITHFLQATGPVEKPALGSTSPTVAYSKTAAGGRFEYSYATPLWTERAVSMCLERVRQFAKQHGDTQWLERYELAMASNLLGLPIGRLNSKKAPRADSAMILYCEGLLWLDQLCKRWENA
ncbi:MAG: phosphotransferase [Rhodopseudomonas palustris]|uniref:Phosphotransferase n=1 Tax=Rhodopseudomonas palustris TaxID=1076 RepID=A0A933RZX8_RHOPL|nr:phosphotransferase [Rhodopseudomonas palustris]